jgi:hypothetical protein
MALQVGLLEFLRCHDSPPKTPAKKGTSYCPPNQSLAESSCCLHFSQTVASLLRTAPQQEQQSAGEYAEG